MAALIGLTTLFGTCPSHVEATTTVIAAHSWKCAGKYSCYQAACNKANYLQKCGYCTCITDGIPAQDMIRVKRYMRRYKAENRMILTGPNCAGTISPGRAMLGIMPGNIYSRGRIGIVGRSGTLGYEAAAQLKALGLGVTTSVGIGGDPINGSSFKDILVHFENDPETDAVLMIGEIGGPQEAEAGIYARDHMKKPLAAYIAGLSAPKGRKMGHAGAIVSAFGESAAEKVDILKGCGVHIVPTPADMGSTLAKLVSGMKKVA